MKPLFARYIDFIVVVLIAIVVFSAIVCFNILSTTVFAAPSKLKLSSQLSEISLSYAIKKALSDQFEIVGAKHTVAKYLDLKKASYSRLLPDVSLASGGIWSQTRNGLPLFASANGDRELIGQVRLTVPIFNPKDYAEISLANSNLTIAKYRLELARLIVSARVARYFYGLALLESQVKVKQRALDKIEYISSATKKEYAAGNLPYIDVVQTELMTDKLRTALNILKIREKSIKRVLAMIIYRKSKNISIALPKFYSSKIYSLNSSNLLKYLFLKAIKNQPLIKAARAEIRSARDKVDISKAGRLPEIDAGSAYGLDTIGSPDAPNIGWQFSVFLNIPVFNFGLNGNYIDASKQRLMAVKSAESAIELSVKERIAIDYGRTKSLIKAVKGAGILVNRSEKVFNMTEDGYMAGALNALSLQEAQDNYIQARLELAKTLSEVYLSLAQLDIDIGVIPSGNGKF